MILGQVDRDFRIINDAYPYIASRLLTDPAEDLQNALRHLLFKDGQHLRWDRLQDLLAEATQVSDYNIAHAADQLVAYLASDRAASVRGLLARECVDVLDQLETETVELIVREGLLLRALQALPSAIVQLGTADSTGGRGRLEYAAVRLMDRIVKELDQRAAQGSSLSAANKTVKILRASHGLSSESASAVTRKVSCTVHITFVFIGDAYYCHPLLSMCLVDAEGAGSDGLAGADCERALWPAGREDNHALVGDGAADVPVSSKDSNISLDIAVCL